MQHLTGFEALDKTYRTNLINALSGFKSPILIGSRDAEGNLNAAVFSSVFHLGANPPLMGFIARPDTVPRDTLENIRGTGSYTFNHLPLALYPQVHHTSARYPREVSEFGATGLTPLFREGVLAPFVAEAVLQIALEHRETQPIPLNGTYLVIGQVTDLWVSPERLASDGAVDLSGTPSVVGLDAYYATEMLERLAYAKPKG
jgi:flavin reductase (DIM6/NTAB) family NADH-FMN oxidoreductase RutF